MTNATSNLIATVDVGADRDWDFHCEHAGEWRSPFSEG